MNSQIIDRKLSFAIMAVFIMQSLNIFVRTIFPEGSFPVVIIRIANLFFPFILFLKNLNCVLNRSKKAVINSYLLFFFTYAMGVLMGKMRGEPTELIITAGASWTILSWLPVGLLVYSVRDKHILVDEAYKRSFYMSGILLTQFLWFLLFGRTSDEVNDYNGSFAYLIVFPLLIHTNRLLSESSKKLLFLVIIEFLSVLIYGNRGVFLCIIVFFILRSIYSDILKKHKLKFIGLILLSVVAIGFIGSRMEMLQSYGINSRLIQYSDSDAETASAGRNYIWLESWNAISDSPIIGYGLGGEYYQLSVRGYKWDPGQTSLTITSASAHNGFLQMMLCFGIPLGLFISFFIITRFFVIKKTDDYIIKLFVITVFSSFIPPVFTIGDGIFIKPSVAFFLYLAMSLSKDAKYRQRLEKQCKNQSKG